MVITKKVPSAWALHRLHQLSFSVPEEVQVRAVADAKSPLGLYVLDFSRPVEIVTDSPAVLEELEAWA